MPVVSHFRFGMQPVTTTAIALSLLLECPLE